MLGMTDVRDVAEAHIRALTNPKAPGQRFICSQKPMWFKDIHAKFAKVAGGKGASTVPTWLFWFLQLWLPEAKNVRRGLDKEWGTDASQTNEILNFQFIPEETTVKEMVGDLAQIGAIGADRCADRCVHRR